MMTENQNLPEMERLKHEEFDMGGEENKILEEIANKVMQDHKHEHGSPLILVWGVVVNGVLLQLREEIELKILKNCYLYDVVKRDIWDSMTVKYKTIMVSLSRNKHRVSLPLSHYVLMNPLLLSTTGLSIEAGGEELPPERTTWRRTERAAPGSEHEEAGNGYKHRKSVGFWFLYLTLQEEACNQIKWVRKHVLV